MRARRMEGKILADRAGCSRVTISRIRNGRQGTSRDLAERIAAALDVPLNRLQSTPGEPVATGLGVSAMTREVLEAMERMSETDRSIAWAFVKGLAASGSSSAAEAAAELASAAQTAERAGEEPAGRKARPA
jgi:transcriptional regulator with XRE-family HTH domain